MKNEAFLELLRNLGFTLPIEKVIVNMAVTAVIALFVFFVYWKTYSGVLYSKTFNITLILVTLVTSMIMMVIGGNLALSLGMVGALSIIRFRTAVKDARDAGFMFWAVAAGLASGTGAYVVAVVGSLFIAGILFVMFREWGVEGNYLLVIKGKTLDEAQIKALIEESTHRHSLKMKNKAENADELVYEVSIRLKEEDELVSKLKGLGEAVTVNLVSYKGNAIG